MSTELAIYDRISNPMEAVKTFGTAIHQSGMFGTAAICQGEVLAMECLARRMPPLMLAERYHIIKGKLSMKADATLAEFIASGGKHEIIERTAERAAVLLTVNGKSQVFSLSWDEAKQEPFIYMGGDKEILAQLAKDPKKLEVKAKYQTPRSRMQMLWARVVSDGVRAMMPTVNCGVYTPEEVEDFAGDNGSNDDNDQPTARKPRTNGKAKQEVATDVAADENVIDVPFDVPAETKPAATPETTAVESKPAPAESAPGSGGCTAEQQARIKELWGLLNVSVEDRDKQLAKRKASTVRGLTAAQADELLPKLEAVWAKKQAEDAPCSQELADQVKVKLTEAEQKVPGTVKRVTEKVNAAGFQKIVELRASEAQSLLDALTGDAMQAFFGQSLWPTPKAAAKN